MSWSLTFAMMRLHQQYNWRIPSCDILYPPPPKRLTAIVAVLATLLAAPATAQLVIPATTGQDACTQDGFLEVRSSELTLPQRNISAAAAQLSLPEITLAKINQWDGAASFRTMGISVRENRSRSPLMQETRYQVRSSTPIAAQIVNFNSLKKNTRYVISLYMFGQADSPLVRICFKTRGEFSNEEAGFQSDGTLPRGPANRLGERGHIVPVGGTGCFRVARTRQDIRDCMCNGTRNGVPILAGQTQLSQQRRQEGGCPDLDS